MPKYTRIIYFYRTVNAFVEDVKSPEQGGDGLGGEGGGGGRVLQFLAP